MHCNVVTGRSKGMLYSGADRACATSFSCKRLPTICTRALKGYTNYYEVLGLPPTATAGEVKAAYRNKARMYHPDVSKQVEASNLFIQCQEAYKTLSDDVSRKQYDSDLQLVSDAPWLTDAAKAKSGVMDCQRYDSVQEWSNKVQQWNDRINRGWNTAASNVDVFATYDPDSYWDAAYSSAQVKCPPQAPHPAEKTISVV